MRAHWHDIVTQTSYNLTIPQDLELIAPVVDCSFTAIKLGDITNARIYYLVRKKGEPTDVFIIMLSLSTQNFKIPGQFQEGTAASICLTVIKDMRLKNMQRYYALSLGYPFEGPLYNVYMPRGVRDDGFSIMEHVPVDLNARYRRHVYTANRSGFYIKSEQSQSNVKNMRR
ncbi:hypothetical protein Poli38472_004230 [Pythium oligandrum]|uniref:Uncharacterized protein n=1 Tax=Pythium oligandrum TaxID=41045 RepID=A0A8K1FJV7_PYTOL|nr:hypothetical protein Poli38472_004230 [Pythium oligandrum]|eukprot:TMW66465.1 hypothetical protein Poli38472_004230 [Pythium oligandrum]